MKIVLVSLLVLLTACTQPVPVKPVWPEIPPVLNETCSDLEQVNTSTDKISDLLTIITDNYSYYHECKFKVEAWIDWYNRQKAIYNTVK